MDLLTGNRPQLKPASSSKNHLQGKGLGKHAKLRSQTIPELQEEAKHSSCSSETVQLQDASAKHLREQMENRLSKQPEEPRDLLEMGVLCRNEFWSKEKLRKIEEARRKKADDELNGCTFKPRRRSMSRSSSMLSSLSASSKRVSNVCNSYAEQYRKLLFCPKHINES